MPVIDALAHGAGDHARLAEPAAAGAAAEDLDRHPLVHRLGERHERLLRVRPRVEVHDGVLRDPPRHALGVGGSGRPAGSARRAGRSRRRRPARRRRRCGRGAAAPRGGRPGMPSAFHARTMSVIARTASSPSPSTAASMKSAIGSGLNAAWPPAMTIGSSSSRSTACSGMPARSSAVEHVGVAELGREAEPEEVEVAHGSVRVDGELRQAVPRAAVPRGRATRHTSARRAHQARSLRTS